MNKINTILLVLLFMAVQAVAGPVSKEEALLKAKAFMADRGMKVVSVNLARKAPSKVSGSNADASSAAYYIFNASAGAAKGSDATGGGFVIISGDDRTVPVLGYSDSGSFNEENMPDNLKAWLDSYADQIAAIEAGAQPARVQSVGTAITQMLKTTWNQGAPYNNNCPEYSSGYKSATGCTATATAQIMNYHESPTTASVIPTYTTGSYNIEVSALVATTFDWENMLDSYSGSEDEANITAVATLMRYVGQSMSMDYGPQSGSTTSRAIKGLVTYMGYNQNATVELRSNYTIQAWHKLIHNELNGGRPVLYGGRSSGGGHSFVIDGYDGASLFHVNWGWGGMCDGYFSLEVLNPNGGGIGASVTAGGYSFDQDCAIGLRPATTADATANPEYLVGEQMVANGTTLAVTLWNHTDATTKFDFGFAVVDDGGNISAIIASRSGDISMDSGLQYTADFSSSSLTNGSTLKVVPVSRETTDDDSKTWKSALQPHQYAILKGGEGDVVSSIEVYPSENLKIETLTLPTIYEYLTCNIVVELENLADECSGVLRLTAVNKANSGIGVEEVEGVYLESGATGSVTFATMFTTAGDYTYKIEYLNANYEEATCILLSSGELTVKEGYLGGTFSITESDGSFSSVFQLINGSDETFSGQVDFTLQSRSVEGAVMSTSYSGKTDVLTVTTGSTINIHLSSVSATEGCEYQWVASYTDASNNVKSLGESRVVAVPVTVEVTDAGYATYCNANRSLDFSAATNIKAYKVTVSGSKAILTEVEKVNKGQGVVLRSSGEATEKIPLLIDGTTESTANLMVGLTAGTTIYETATEGSDTYTNYVLAKKNGNIAFYKANTAGSALAAGKAYLRVLSTSPASYFSLDSEDDGTTGINEAVNAPANDNAFYTLQGIRVDTPTKGLYIHRGRVVLVK